MANTNLNSQQVSRQDDRRATTSSMSSLPFELCVMIAEAALESRHRRISRSGMAWRPSVVRSAFPLLHVSWQWRKAMLRAMGKNMRIPIRISSKLIVIGWLRFARHDISNISKGTSNLLLHEAKQIMVSIEVWEYHHVTTECMRVVQCLAQNKDVKREIGLYFWRFPEFFFPHSECEHAVKCYVSLWRTLRLSYPIYIVTDISLMISQDFRLWRNAINVDQDAASTQISLADERFCQAVEMRSQISGHGMKFWERILDILIEHLTLNFFRRPT